MALLPDFKTRESFRVRSYDIGIRKQLTVPTLVRFMHETATTNAIRLKISAWDLEPEGISWVLARKRLTINRLPKLGETITVETYPAGLERFYTYRDYLIYDENGERVAVATTMWVLMDIVARKMTRIPDYILRFEMPNPMDCLTRTHFRMTKLQEVHLSKSFQVGWYNLDFNKHLNNIYYLQWILETLPDKILQFATLNDIRILHKLECKWKEIVVVETEIVDEYMYRHRLIRQSDNKNVALAETTWASND